MYKIVLRGLAVIFAGVVSGIIGLIGGAFIGGNFAQQFVFNGVRGYEATGQLGSIFGALIGLISSWRFLFKKNHDRFQDNYVPNNWFNQTAGRSVALIAASSVAAAGLPLALSGISRPTLTPPSQTNQ